MLLPRYAVDHAQRCEALRRVWNERTEELRLAATGLSKLRLTPLWERDGMWQAILETHKEAVADLEAEVSALAWALDQAVADREPFCACGRRRADCDGSRAACMM